MLCLALFYNLNRQIGRADGHIQKILTGNESLYRLFPPFFVNIERQKMVQPVVRAGDAVEKGADVVFFVHKDFLILYYYPGLAATPSKIEGEFMMFLSYNSALAHSSNLKQEEILFHFLFD